MTVEFPLTREKVTLVDEIDLPSLEPFSWRAQQNQDGRWYAVAWDTHEILIMMHRWIMSVEDPKLVVDHFNNDGLDNRRLNLRVCTYSQNVARGRPTEGRTSKFKGVHFEASRRKFKAVISKDRNFHFLGRFENEAEAARAYDKAALEIHGEFAYLNFPEEE